MLVRFAGQGFVVGFFLFIPEFLLIIIFQVKGVLESGYVIYMGQLLVSVFRIISGEDCYDLLPISTLILYFKWMI
ncbi:hypothetical protein DSAG12_00617 [Promethearchaeum syntrophicum]|uniref:Uncharacterized protein n=1 Tax=Promethearchaeum syntrophicum TaxID=2594042 RepID=A0A5B9D7U5_9ARCH|nr:hypothetical protein [Candidatus Prometheoarchaeum syntrophicum]QEE14800.1 hypothetical protein DSAG12_00617 [Candidatus Prometheoarchaeum syntrophicum]